MEKVTDYDVLKRSHRFVREDDDKEESWEDRVARNYESKLFREYALIDLKHYKSNRYALRWRTATEVVDGIGDETCAGLRCERHREKTRTEAFELPFVYVEDGERKETMVKVKLCRRCGAKLTWKPEERREKKEKSEGREDRREDRSKHRKDRDRSEGGRGGRDKGGRRDRSRERDRSERTDIDRRSDSDRHRDRDDERDRRRREERERSRSPSRRGRR